MDTTSCIYVAGHSGMVGSAIVRKLKSNGYANLIYRSSKELDLRSQNQVEVFFRQKKPRYVFLAAARVGGILANNTYRADFLYDNLMIQSNIIEASFRHKVEKLLFLGSSCIYPKLAPQPIREESLLSGVLEPTNEPYAVAKIAGIKLCDAYRFQHNCNFISVISTNLYGPNDNFDLQTSHVLPALLRKFHEAIVKGDPDVVVWGSGTPRREFLHVDDLADACLFLMHHYNEFGPINVGTGYDLSILELALLIQRITGFTGNIRLDHSKPDGTPRKVLDVSKIHQLGWQHNIELEDGIRDVYTAYSAMFG